MGFGKKTLFHFLLSLLLMTGFTSLGIGKTKAKDYPPDQPGPYNVGIRTFENVPMSGGRLTRVQIFYPTSEPADCDTKYLIQGVGGNFERQSLLCAVPNAAPAAGLFPLVVHDHGGGAAGNDAQRISQMPLHELMASHGFIVALARHSANNIARIQDIPIVLDFMLSENNPVSGSIDEDRIGLSGFSAGGRAALGVAGGWTAQGLAADSRFKAMVVYEPSRDNSLEDIATISIPYLIMGGTRFISATETVSEVFEASVDALPRIYVKNPEALHFNYQSDLCYAIEETRELALAANPQQSEPLTNMLTPTAPNCEIDPTTGICRRICNPALSAPAFQACTFWNQGELFINLVGRAFGGGRNICNRIGTSPDSNRSLDTHPADGFTDEFLGGDPLVALFEGNDIWNSDASHQEPPLTFEEMQPAFMTHSVAFWKKFLAGDGQYMRFLTPGYAKVHNFPAIVDIRD
ncbi:MAG TPA: hypothetical protein VFW62_08575 [bacterium]|nr:hypothetical protein [bacterium]